MKYLSGWTAWTGVLSTNQANAAWGTGGDVNQQFKSTQEP